MLYILALYEAARLGQMQSSALASHIAELRAQNSRIEQALDGWRMQMEQLAHKYCQATTFLYLGRGIHYAIAREGALKLKEASYVHAEGYPAGELKHVPERSGQRPRAPRCIGHIRSGTGHPPSVLHYEKTLQLLRELRTQGARVIAIANAGDDVVQNLATDCVQVPPTSEYLLPLIEVVPLQLFAYFMALQRNVDVDRPRNLTKAVVESSASAC